MRPPMRLIALIHLIFLFSFAASRFVRYPPSVSRHIDSAKQKFAGRNSFFRDLKVTFSHFTRSKPRSQLHDTSGSSSLQKRGFPGSAPSQCIVKAPFSTATSSRNSGATSRATASSTRRASTTATTTKTSTGAQPTQTSPWKLTHSHSGSSFFDDFYFWSTDDPTGGTVDYTTKEEAQSNNLISITDDGEAIMRVETTPQVSGYRKSVRIHSSYMVTGGLWLLDATHMPGGCGTWPAFWTHGPNWPQWGEIDIIEGVNDNQYNQAALHTSSGCTIPENFGGTGKLTGGSICGVQETSNTGCGIRAVEKNTYGPGFNSIGGGVYALLWDNDGLSIWFFPRDSISNDIASETPLPSTWGTPSARWPASTCPPFQYNQNHTTIINTTLCGEWAGGVWANSGNGGTPSCAIQTGKATCAEYVASQGDAFSEAYWQIRSLKIYQAQ